MAVELVCFNYRAQGELGEKRAGLLPGAVAEPKTIISLKTTRAMLCSSSRHMMFWSVLVRNMVLRSPWVSDFRNLTARKCEWEYHCELCFLSATTKFRCSDLRACNCVAILQDTYYIVHYITSRQNQASCRWSHSIVCCQNAVRLFVSCDPNASSHGPMYHVYEAWPSFLERSIQQFR